MTWKELNEQKLSQLFPVFADRARAFLNELESLGFPFLITEGLRTYETQDAYFAEGRTAMSKVGCTHAGHMLPPGTCREHPFGATITNARAGLSWHQFALAIDICPDDTSKDGLQIDWNVQHPAWQKALEIGEKYKLAEGARWRTITDNPHFYPQEIPPTPPQSVRDIYAKEKLPGVWELVSKQFGLTA